MLTLIGYFPKKVVQNTEPSVGSRVKAIRSVSECISKGPEGWFKLRNFNAFDLYSTIDGALEIVPMDQRGEYELQAYRLLAVEWGKGKERMIAIPEISVEPLPERFESVGFDVVSLVVERRVHGHSPLSCNYLARKILTNGHCLLDDLGIAKAVAMRFSRGEEAEPGPYYVVEVLRRME